MSGSNPVSHPSRRWPIARTSYSQPPTQSVHGYGVDVMGLVRSGPRGAMQACRPK
jgi:hypothetical protein